MKAEDITARILEAYPGALIDPQGEDCSFSVTIVSEAFAGQSPIQRQKPILALFKQEITSGELHALSVIARTPQES